MLSQPKNPGSTLVAAMLIISSSALLLQAQSGQLNFTGSPNYGEVRLQANFEPDPHTASVTSGGAVNASYLPGACMGWAAASPDYRITWSGSSDELRILFESESGMEDGTLIINMPDGSWVCNDDAMSGSLDPMVVLDDPAPGQYDIWVGSLGEGDYISGMLIVTEYPLNPGDYDWVSEMSGGATSSGSGDNLLDFTADPSYGSVELRSGFSPDPYTVAVAAGGFVSLGKSNAAMAGCRGYATTNPDSRCHENGIHFQLRTHCLAYFMRLH